MLNLSELKKPVIHPTKKTFKKYSNAAIGKLIGIAPGYFSSIMNGHSRPSAELLEKILNLEKEIIATEKAQGN